MAAAINHDGGPVDGDGGLDGRRRPDGHDVVAVARHGAVGDGLETALPRSGPRGRALNGEQLVQVRDEERGARHGTV